MINEAKQRGCTIKRRCSSRIRGNGLTESIEKIRYLLKNSTINEVLWVQKKVYPEISIEDLMLHNYA